LLRAGIACVEGWAGVTALHLGVTASQAAARRLYERHGFVAWGIQPDAVWVDGIMLAEVHMVREMGAAL
jgi:RimJ/RimL family protein N-acetyltransferase